MGGSAPARPRGEGIALIGYRGTGKSTVGRILARALDRPFFDADRELEARSGRSIASIFREDGEPAFRDLEERIIAELTAGHPLAVLATGGGAVLRETSRTRLRGFGLVVWLTGEPAELARRLQSDPSQVAGRPSLTAAGTLAEIAEVLAVRSPIYAGLADMVVPTDGRRPDEVVDAILARRNP